MTESKKPNSARPTPPDVELISIRAYAALRGCSRAAIRKLIKAGKIPTFDGKIHPETADAAYERNTNPAARLAGQAAKKATQIVDRLPPADQPSELARVRTAISLVDLQIKKKQLERVRENRLDRAAVEGTIFALIRATREAWRTWPTKVAPSIAAELGIDAERFRVALQRHVDAELDATQDNRLKLP